MTTLTTKSIKDYLHLYLNEVDVIISTVSDEFKTHFGHAPGHKTQLGPMLFAVILEGHVTVKPILRNLSGMTEEEMKELGINSIDELRGNTGQIIVLAKDIPYLLSKGFDLFNLIPEGLAIDKSKL